MPSSLILVGELSHLLLQGVANMLWAFARFNVSPSGSMLVEFFAATDRRLSSFKPQELSNMIWALAKVGGNFGCWSSRML
jgi:hypothetical protein